MADKLFGNTEDELLIPSGFFDVEDNVWNPLPYNELKYTSEKVVKRLYSLGRTISKVFSDFNLHYWAHAGTTLGVLRHKGLIPWDDDLDICVLEKYEDILVGDIRKVLETEHEIKMMERYYGYVLFHKTESEEFEEFEEFKEMRYPYLDVFIMRPMLDGNTIMSRSARCRAKWPKEWYEMSDVLSSSSRPFADFQLSVCNNPEKYLSNFYGDDWTTIGITQEFCHVTGRGMHPRSFKMNAEMYLPAYPFR